MDSRRYYVFTVVQIVGAACLLWFLFSMRTPWDLQRRIGSVLVVAGVAGIAVARYQLGRSFAVRAEAHQLVTHGVYSKIRNPIYVFGAVVIAGIVLATHRPILWLLLLFHRDHAGRARPPRSPGPRSCLRRRLPRIPPQDLVLKS